MKSKVYFIKVSGVESVSDLQAKLRHLIKKSGVFSVISPGDTTAVKMHFGEQGNTGFVKPELVRVAVDSIFEQGARPFLTDTNTLYRGRRMTSQDHLKLAHEHGFTPEKVGAEVTIAEDETNEIAVGGKFIKSAKVASLFTRIDALVGIAHFKGHIMTGFGSALKNIGMGCATRKGKLAQHSDISPFVITKTCTACGACIQVCPVKAIAMVNKKAHIDPEICIGCASCIAACKFNSIEVNWDAGGDKIQEKMVEYAKAVLQANRGKCSFINVATKITAECDCLAQDDPRIAPDIGFFVSTDPVALDKATLDKVLEVTGSDCFRQAHPKRDGLKQLKHAQKIGIGNLEYELIEILLS